MPRKGFNGKPRPPLAALRVDRTSPHVFKLILECPHGEWTANYRADQVRPVSEEEQVEEMLVALTTELVTLHDAGGHPVRCVKEIRPVAMGTPRTRETPEPYVHEPILVLIKRDAQLLVDVEPYPPHRYRIRMNCDHNFAELMVHHDEVEDHLDGDIGAARFLWEQIIYATQMHMDLHAACECLRVPTFEQLLESAQVAGLIKRMKMSRN